jgi:hypothetical protein
MNPFGTRAGLSKAAPGHHQPHPPALAGRRQLAVMRPGLEVSIERQQVARRHRRDQLGPFVP